MPIGFKNGNDCNVTIAIDAVLAAAQPHSFLGMHKNGRIAVVRTRGNPHGHVILRGGRQPNFWPPERRRGGRRARCGWPAS